MTPSCLVARSRSRACAADQRIKRTLSCKRNVATAKTGVAKRIRSPIFTPRLRQSAVGGDADAQERKKQKRRNDRQRINKIAEIPARAEIYRRQSEKPQTKRSELGSLACGAWIPCRQYRQRPGNDRGRSIVPLDGIGPVVGKEIIPIGHANFCQGFRVHHRFLVDDVALAKNEGHQRIDFVRFERARRGVRHRGQT